MAGLLDRLRRPVASRVKRALAGDDVDALVQRRDRRRLRWLASETADPLARFRAVRCLAELVDPEAAPLFLGLLAEDAGEAPTATLRVAVEGLGRLRTGSAGGPIRRLLNPERPAQVQLAAARALASIGREEDWSAVRGWATATTLLPDDRDLSDPAPDGLPPGADLVMQVLQPLYADKAAKWWATKARSWLESDDARPRIPAMEGADKIVAQQLRRSLDRLDGAEERRALLHLGALSRDRDRELLSQRLPGRAARQALGLQGDPRSLDTLTAATTSASTPSDARDALRALGRLGWRGAESTIAATRDRFDDDAVRVEAAFALGEIGGEDAIRVLMDDLRKRPDRADPSDAEAEWIARALRRCGVRGREAIRGARTIAISKGERRRVERIAELAGLP